MIVGIYTRVSTQEQAKEGYSLGEQEERLKSYCDARGWTVGKVYTDGGFSGGNTNRPALQQLKKDVEGKKLDVVLVYKLDRLSRSQKDTLTLIEDTFIKNGVEFVSLSENFDTSTPFGRAMIGILSVFAQLEREQIKERMMLGRVGRAKEGYFHGGGFVPIGYDYVEGELIINEYEAMQVREIYDLFLKNYPVTRIWKIIRKKYTNKYGNWRSESAVRSCLTSPLYCGKVSYDGEIYEGKHEAIVTEEEYNKVQNKLQERRESNKGKSPFKPTKLLSGIIWCGNCGARYYSHHINSRAKSSVKEGWDYYSCYSRGNKKSNMCVDPTCKNKNWNVKQADALVINEILKLSFDKDYLTELAQANKEETNKENDQLVLKERIEELSKQIDKVMDMYQLNLIPLEKLSKRMEELNEEKENLERELSYLEEEKKDTKIALTDVKTILENAEMILNGDDMDDKRNLVRSLIEYIEFFDDHIEIHWYF